MNEYLSRIKTRKRTFWILSIAYLIFEGCFNFPLGTRATTPGLDTYSLLIFAVTCAIIGIIFAGLIEKLRFLMVFALTLLCTLTGMGCRYLLEFGEVSNTVNFTKINIGIYLLSVPILVTLVYVGTQLYNRKNQDQ